MQLQLIHKKANMKLAIAKTNMKLQNPGLVVFYDIWSGNAVALFLQSQNPHTGTDSLGIFITNRSYAGENYFKM